MEKLNLETKDIKGDVEPVETVESLDMVKKEEIKEKKYLNKKDKEELDKLIFDNEMDRITELKRFVSSVLEDNPISGTTAVYFEEPNGFKVQIFKGFVQSSMDSNKLLPADRSLDLGDYEKIADFLKKNTDIVVDAVNEAGVFGTVPMFSKDKYVSSRLGINPEDSEKKKEMILNYMNGQYSQEEERSKINKIKESIYSLFKKGK